MMDKYMNQYCKQMDEVKLSDAADQMILNDILKADARKGVSHGKRIKRNLSAAAIAVIVIIFSSATIFAGVMIHGTIVKSHKTEIEGFGTKVDLGESYYYDLLAGDAGELYALTDSDYDGALTDYHAIVWKSTDQGDTWEAVLSQPDELNDESYLLAGDLWEEKSGIEATVIIQENDLKEEGIYTNRVYRVTADSYVEYDMDEVYALIGGQDHLFNVKYVNDCTIALVAGEKCLLYNTKTQKVEKELPYDLTMGCLLTQDQFLIYGREIYSCIDVNSLGDQEPEAGLQEFVQMMYEKNNREVFPPMQAQGDTVVCVTKMGIYEYQDGEITQIRQLSAKVNGVRTFNGLLPVCKGQEGEYYICTFFGSGMAIWQIDSEKEEMKTGSDADSSSMPIETGEHINVGS